MLFRDRTYSALIVSAHEKFNKEVSALLPVGEYWPVKTVKSAGEARRLLAEKSVDIVLINSPLPDDSGTSLATDVCESTDSSVMLFVRSELYDDVSCKVMEHGVVCISKPTTRQGVTQSLRLMCATRERMARMEAKQATVEERMEEIRVINRAKWKLIDSGMSENEAHKYIERHAMDLRMTKREIAQEILDKPGPV